MRKTLNKIYAAGTLNSLQATSRIPRVLKPLDFTTFPFSLKVGKNCPVKSAHSSGDKKLKGELGVSSRAFLPSHARLLGALGQPQASRMKRIEREMFK